MEEQTKRISIYKYVKSGRLAGITTIPGYKGYTVLDMSPNLTDIVKVRSVGYLKRDSIQDTGYILEAIESTRKNGNGLSMSYQFVRILTKDDLDLSRWNPSESLHDLPISPHPHISEEEEWWAGKRPGNIEAGVVLILWTFFVWWLLYLSVPAKSAFGIIWGGFVFLAALYSTYSLIKFEWRPDKDADPNKLKELMQYKEKLRDDAELKRHHAKTAFLRMLEDYSGWERLSPEEFEHALTFRLGEEGYSLKVTKYVGDGGVDLEGLSPRGNPIVVQAKKYRSNVGVAVVREMIGVRESRPDKPDTMIVSLTGFTRGAKELAEKESVILRTIKEDILKV